MPKQLALSAWAGAEAKCDGRPTILIRFRSARPPTPARPRKGGGSARGRIIQRGRPNAGAELARMVQYDRKTLSAPGGSSFVFILEREDPELYDRI